MLDGEFPMFKQVIHSCYRYWKWLQMGYKMEEMIHKQFGTIESSASFAKGNMAYAPIALRCRTCCCPLQI